jgi:hypothetical protein
VGRTGHIYRLELRLDQRASPRHDEVLFERDFRPETTAETP